jgi:CO/xanthine dehydrogenase Mo-binding subunit
MTSFMAGRAVIKAADDAILQLKNYASILLRCPVEDLEMENLKIYVKNDPKYFIGFAQLVTGIKFSNGNGYGGHVLGRGSYIMSQLTNLNTITGEGKPGPAWTVGAQAVEVEYDTKDHTYRLVKAATVMDIGRLINPNATASMIRGGMSMGLSLASREELIYDERGVIQNTSFRNYKLLHIGQEPKYLIDFVQTPQEDAPYKTRVYTEHGIIGMPAALANALSLACGKELNNLPLTPENIWRICTE